MRNLFLYLIVFVAGAAVLAVEILGTRILGPFYGVSLFLWSALISVTLIALSVGYAVGGRWADKGAKMSRLGYLMAGAGLWLLLIPWIKQPVLLISEPLGLRFAVLLTAFILFVPPLTLLGMVSPYAIRVRASSLNVVGRTAGNLYAISTVGSVISALFMGFILIPKMGVSRLTMMIGMTLIIVTLIGQGFEFKSNPIVGLALLLIGATLIWFRPGNVPAPEQGLLAVEQSPYAEIRVLDLDNRRHLLIDGGLHTIVDPLTWESHFPYVEVLDIAQFFFEKPGSLLLIGLGGGSVAKNYAKAGWTVDAVEIDPVVVNVAQKYFGLIPSDGQVFTLDGREFLNSHNQNYDIIIMDAFGSSSIPFHLVTKESFGLFASHLKSSGVVALNIEARTWQDQIVQSITATLKTHFSYVLALPIEKSSDELGNIVILASSRELEFPVMRLGQDTEFENRPKMNFNRNRAWMNRFIPDTRHVPVLTDDLNPVDLWSEEINITARKDLHSYFKQSGLTW